MSTTSKPVPPKAGVKTSEFWSSVLSQLIGAAMVGFALFSQSAGPDMQSNENWIIAAIGGLVVSLSDAIYKIGRAKLKAGQ